MLRLAKLLSACAVVIGLTLPAVAQEFPSRTVKIVMGFGPGGLGDIAGRAIGEVMSKSIGQPVIIENRLDGKNARIYGVSGVLPHPG